MVKGKRFGKITVTMKEKFLMVKSMEKENIVMIIVLMKDNLITIFLILTEFINGLMDEFMMEYGSKVK